MNRRALLKLLGGAIVAGALPKPPLAAQTLTSSVASKTRQLGGLNWFGYSEKLKRFVLMDEIEWTFLRDWTPYSQVVVTNLGEIITKGTISVPVKCEDSRIAKQLFGISIKKD